MSKPRWVRTLVAQVALCIALYFAFQLGQPQKFVYNKRSESRPIDLYFISVRGGFRPVFQQTHLLKQVAKVAKTYKARFVVNISELGEDDPLTQNATQLVPTLKVPWYTTRVSKVHEEGYFLKQVNIPYGKTLDIIGVNTGFLQDALQGPSNETGNNQLHWLTRTVEASRGNWRIVVGFHSFVVCGERSDEMEANQILETLQNTFTKFEVNAYISGQDCDNHVHQGSIGYNENPGLAEKRPSISFSNGRSVSKRDLVNGFLLHRVSSIELATYFVNSSGEVVHRSVVQQRGKEATQQVPTLKVPWYTTRVSKVHEEGYFLKQVNIPYGKTLDIIGVNTGFLQDALRGPSNETGNNQLHWLTRTVEASRGNWRIVVGFHSFAVCGERSDEMEANQILETLQNTFTKFEVNAYISGQDCDNHAHQGSIGYNENPGLAEKRPSISFSNGRSVSKRDLVNGFLLHRVSSIELATYFVNSSGEVVHRSVVQQRGKEVM